MGTPSPVPHSTPRSAGGRARGQPVSGPRLPTLADFTAFPVLPSSSAPSARPAPTPPTAPTPPAVADARRVDPPCLSQRIPLSFGRGVMELPLCTPPPGVRIVPVPLRKSPAALSAAAIVSPEDAHFGRLLQACLEWHAPAVSAVSAYAAMSPAAQAAFRACHGGRDAAADLQLGLSLFAQCLDALASAWFPVVAGPVLSASAVPAPASALTAVLGLWAQRISALAVSAPSGAAVPAAPATSSPPSSSLPSRQ